MDRENDAKKGFDLEGTVEGFGAGFIAAVVLGVSAGIGLTIVGLKNPHNNASHEPTEFAGKFRNQVGYGVSLGTGFVVAATALNWAVEQWDKLQSNEGKAASER